MKETINLKNKNIIIIGALGRLGRVVSSQLLDKGANVIAVDLDQDLLNKESSVINSSKYLAFSGNSNDLDSINSVFQVAEDKFGRVDGAVNLSYPKNKNYGNHFFDVSYEDFCENVSLHLGAYFLFMQQCAKYSIDHDIRFSLINFSSIYGVISPKFDIYEGTKMTVPVEYAAIKSSLIHLASYLTAYTKGTSFRVNSISPGGIIDGQDSKFLRKYRNNSRSKGMLDPEDIVGTVLYLLSDSSEFVCGQNIIVDDAFTI